MRNRYVLMLDLPLIALAAFGAFALRFEWVFLEYRPEFLPFLLIVLFVKPLVLFLFGMHSRYWRYATADDLLAVTVAVSAASVVVVICVGLGLFLGVIESFSRPVLLNDWLLTLALIGGVRMSIRIIGEAHQRAQRTVSRAERKQVLVVGAGAAGTMVVRELQRNPQLGLTPIGFLDDAPDKQGKWILGVRVLGRVGDLTGLLERHGVGQVIIAMPTASGSIVRAVAETCRLQRIESRIVPGVYELLDGQVNVSRLRTVEITDLLRREHLLSAYSEDAGRYLKDATVLVTGAGGSIGQELCRQVAHAQPARLLLLGHGENSIFNVQQMLQREFPAIAVVPVIADIRDETRIDAVFTRYRPDVVLHAAAHKHVPLMEENAPEAVSNNVFGTRIVAGCASRHGARRFVLISTDKAVAPTSIMGASKRIAELVVRDMSRQGAGTAFMVVRFGNVLGSRGSVVPLFKAQIERGGPVTITHPDMKRFFMTIPEAVNLVLRAGGLGRGGELFVLNMGQPVRIADLAEDLIKLSGFSPGEIPIVYTDIRPGEKLEESLWDEGARVDLTADGDILQVKETDSDPAPLDGILQALERAVRSGDRLTVEATLAESVPTFVPGLPTTPSPVRKQ